jgi:hypothetical protein
MSFEKAFINQLLRIILSPRYLGIFPHEIGKKLISHWERGRYSAQKTQSENHCKHFNSILQTPTKFVLFSNQKGKKIFSSLKLLGNSVHNKSRSTAIVYDFVEKVLYD